MVGEQTMNTYMLGRDSFVNVWEKHQSQLLSLKSIKIICCLHLVFYIKSRFNLANTELVTSYCGK